MNTQLSTESALRRALARYPVPSPSPALTDEIVNLVQARERACTQTLRPTRRLVLGVYWLAATIVSAWIVWSMPLPEWRPRPLSGWSAVLIPLCFAAALWYTPLIAYLKQWSAQLLQLSSASYQETHPARRQP